MQRILAFLMIIFSFFIKGDMTKTEMTPETEIKAGATSATFIFENKTGKPLDLHIYIEKIEMEKDGKWEEVSYIQMLDDVDFVYPCILYPGQKTDLSVEFRQREVYSEPVTMPLEEGNYRVTVAYKTSGTRRVQEATKTFDFTVAPA